MFLLDPGGSRSGKDEKNGERPFRLAKANENSLLSVNSGIELTIQVFTSVSSGIQMLALVVSLLLLSHFSRVRLCATPSLGFSRQEHWSGLPFPSPCGVFRDSPIELLVTSTHSRGNFCFISIIKLLWPTTSVSVPHQLHQYHDKICTNSLLNLEFLQP